MRGVFCHIVAVCGNIMNWQNVTKWCREFFEGRTNVHNEQRISRPSLISDDLLQEIEGEICANRCMTVRELHHIIPKVSNTTINEAVAEQLGYRHDNWQLHSTHVTTAFLEKFKWDIFDQPPYSPDLVPSDFHFFFT
jgi:hypothetical protein